MDCSPQALLSMGLSKQERCSGLPFSSPGNLPDPGIEPTSPALAGRFFTTEPLGKPRTRIGTLKKEGGGCVLDIFIKN